MPTMKIRTNRQVTVPKAIFDELGLKEGDFVDVTQDGSRIVIEPKRLVNFDETLSADEEAAVERGFRELKRGNSVPWNELKDELGL
jgi:AbrB family looped-hinge helix DNA binding protein